jgi:diguanylate cyclase (GGDEF)-like protein
MFTLIPTAVEVKTSRASAAEPPAPEELERAKPAVADAMVADGAAGGELEDLRSTDPVERLLEDSWESRSRAPDRREQTVEALASLLFLCLAGPLAIVTVAHQALDLPLIVALVLLYAISSRLIMFPIGAGYVVPSYLVLVPMLLLLPPGIVPLLTGAGLLLGTLVQVAGQRAGANKILASIPDAWHSLGPAAVLVLAGRGSGAAAVPVYAGAFAAGCLLDLVSAMVRDAAILGVGRRVQIRVIAQVWMIDASLAPVGLVIAHAAQHRPLDLLLMLPLDGLLVVLSRDRSARIVEAQRRLDVVARERRRLQIAVGRLGEALAAKLDLNALTDIVLRGSIEALDAEGGRLTLSGPISPMVLESDADSRLGATLRAAADAAHAEQKACRVNIDGICALALPFGFASAAGSAYGAIAVAREEREFRDDEQEVMERLVERARVAAADIIAHRLLREQAYTDSLTKLGNRRALTAELEQRLAGASVGEPLLLLLFDLDGFKAYNDTFGHLAGDALLARLGGKLASAVSEYGAAYRLGGDEFCALVAAPSGALDGIVAQAAEALSERGEKFAVGASYGAVLLPHEAASPDYAMQLADERMYARKRGRKSSIGDQTRDVLVQMIAARRPELHEHCSDVALLCRRVGGVLELSPEALEELARAAELHDVGKVGVPDAILSKEEPLTEAEREFVGQHTILGERILSAVPALREIAAIVRSTRERWDGRGYPDGLAGEQIPLAARIVAACDAYEAMQHDRGDRRGRAHEEVLDHLRAESGRQFDPSVVAALLEVLRNEEQRLEGREESHARVMHEALAAHKLRTVQDSSPPAKNLTASTAHPTASGAAGRH